MTHGMRMRCAYCGRNKVWPTDFPVRHLARCCHCEQRQLSEYTSSDYEVVIGVILIAAILITALVSWALTL